VSYSLEWMDNAACVGHPTPDIFFPSETGVPGRRQAEEAEMVCAGCPVRERCREHKKATGAASGIWGGSRSARGATSPSMGGNVGNGSVCGTEKGYQRHRRKHERACQACFAAHSAYGSPNGRSRVGQGRRR
jgi:WhiB family redox-sensing transcriptional regulator